MSQWRDATPELQNRAELVTSSIQQVHKWLEQAATIKPSTSARQLASVLRDTNGLEFTVGFVDGVVRPESLKVAAKNLRSLRDLVPGFLPFYMRAAFVVGASLAEALPAIVVPIARKVLRRMVSHLIIDASDSKLGKSLDRVKSATVSLNVNLLGEAVLGKREAEKRLDGTRRLLENPSVDYVSMKVSAAVAPHNPWAFDETVEEIVEKLTPLFKLAASFTPNKFINLDMEEYKDLRLTIEVFKRILGRSDLQHLNAGIVLQTYLPDAMDAMHELQLWARERRALGGAPIKVRIVKGANLSMETVDAELHDWPLAVVGSKRAADTNYKHVVNYALTPEHLRNIEVGIAGHNLFDIAFANALMKSRGITSGVTFEMLLGMAEAQAKVVSSTVGGLLLYTPVVHPNEFDVAIAYLIRRLEESASQDNFMSAVFELHENSALLERETERFKLSIDHFDDDFAPTNRVQDRRVAPKPIESGFSNSADSDPATSANKHWASDIFARAQNSTLAIESAKTASVQSVEQLDAIIERSLLAATKWQSLSAQNRASVLHELGNQLESHRGELIEVMISEAGKTFDQADPEVSEAVDFAHYYAERSLDLANLDGAKHLPEQLVLVTPPWNFPVAIAAGSTIAALAAGSAVLLKPAPQVNRCGVLLAEILTKAGLPNDLLTAVVVEEGQLGRQLVSHKSIERIVLTGAIDTARLFKSFKPELKLIAETSGKNSIIVTESADLDLAARDVVLSAFGHAGQKCSAASVVILVGSVAKSKRFLNQLVDATSSLVVDYATNALAQVGPLIEAPGAKLRHGLTQLDGNENWLIEPKQLDETGRLWSPGIRQHVEPGSPSHLQEYFGPVLSVMTAKSLEEAIAIQNGSDFGLTAGIHSLDAVELELWLDRVEAGNLYVNRGITGAIVQRQPFGGWKRSVVGATAKAGGPNYLLGFGRFESDASSATSAASQDAAELLKAIESLVDVDTFAALTRSAASDTEASVNCFSQATDATGLRSERNILRYRPAKTMLRIGAGASDFERYRLTLAAIEVGASISAADLEDSVIEVLKAHGCPVSIQTTQQWLETLDSQSIERVRVIAEPDLDLGVEVAIYDNAPVESGRIELLCYWREQSIAITDHRFGNPLKASNRVWN